MIQMTIIVPTPTNVADQQRGDSDPETEIQLLLVNIRNLNAELFTS